MKNRINICAFIAGLFVIAIFYACKKEGVVGAFNIEQTNLVSDTAGFNAAKTDTNLVNAWGIAANTTGAVWISSNHKGVSVIYDKTGNTLRAPVMIPAAIAGQAGSPTGMVFNNTASFVIPGTGQPAKFMMSSEDGVINAWNSGNSAVTVANRSANDAVYKGLAMGQSHGNNFLYATNFKGGTVDVFDQNFNFVTSGLFKDPNIPSDFGPFNIRNIDNNLYVTYAKHLPPDNMDDEKGVGNGYVDIYNTDGTLIKRLITQGSLNSPWGITEASAGFCDPGEVLLVGNFGDGKINVYTLNGHFKGQLQNKGSVITIPGLWAIDFLHNNATDGLFSDKMFFTAGPDDESHGLFGYLKKAQ